jgi:hypothetical protein
VSTRAGSERGAPVLRIVGAGLVTALVGAVLTAAIVATRSSWAELAPATCLPGGCFCEAVRPEGLAQPVNSITSLAYVALGLWALTGGAAMGRPQRDTQAWVRTLVRAAGVVLVALGLGSFVYHGTLTLVGQVLDVQGMYLLGMLILLGALVRRGALTPRVAPWIYVGTCVLLAAAQVVAPDSRRFLFALVLLPGIVMEALPGTTGVSLRSPSTIPYRTGVVLLVVAYGVWLLDNTGVVCWPTSVLQGHGLWHVLTAVAAVLVVSHYMRTPGGHYSVTPADTPPPAGPGSRTRRSGPPRRARRPPAERPRPRR